MSLELDRTESGIRHHYTHVYRLVHKWGFKQKVPRRVHVNTASTKEKEKFQIKKGAKVVLDNLPRGFTAVSMDESFFILHL